MTTKPEHRAARRHRPVPVKARAALGLGVVLCTGVLGTHAYWTDAVAVTGATFSTGTLDLQVNGADANADFSTISLSGMVPGSSAAGVLTVKNNGSVPLKYTATGAVTNADGKGLGTALVAKVTADTATTGTTGSKTCASSALTGTGTSLSGSLVTTGRLLAAGTSEKLCVQVTLPTTAASSLQGATAGATLTFTGTSDLS